jgi:hypothetical protein
MDSETERLLTKIHDKGYWRVAIVPARYERQRIPSLSKCQEIVEAASVRLRGWDYPHIDRNVRNRQSWVESWIDWIHGHLEYWRFYQSGQFVHHFAMREDYEDSSADVRGLDFLNSLYTFTEIFEFAARLAAREALTSGATISVTLHGTNGRRIISWDRRRHLFHDYVAADREITFDGEFSEQMLLANAAHMALDATRHVLERFNSPVPSGLIDEQTKFLERRLD